MKLNDRPVWHKGDDELGRAPVAQAMAEEIKRFDSSDGCVVAVNGPWGSGKTSLIKLMEPTLRDAGNGCVIWFNPWYFSGTDDLITRFFHEISVVLGRVPRYKAIAEGAEKFGTALMPTQAILSAAAPPLGLLPSIAKVPKKLMEIWKGGVEEQKLKLSQALRAAETNFYIVIDDLDRLAADEIRDIVRLVRLTGSLPTVTYILAFDQKRVEEALAEEGISGRDYLEKIVFASFDVPRINRSHIRHTIEVGLNDVLARVDRHIEVDSNRVYGVFHELFLREIRNLRSAKRFVASSGLVVSSLGHEVDLLDLLCLECIRLFKPDVFVLFLEFYNHLSWAEEDSGLLSIGQGQRAKDAVDKILELDRSETIKWVLKNLFPMAWAKYDDDYSPPQNFAEMSRDRRVGHRHFMAMYAERFEDRSIVARRRADELVRLNPEMTEYDRFLTSMPLDELADVADIVAEMTSHISREAIVPLSSSLLRMVEERPVRRNRGFDSGVDEPVQIITARLLDSLEREERLPTLCRIYEQMRSMQTRYRVVQIGRMVDGSGISLIDEDGIRQLEERFAEDFRGADPRALSTEHWLLFLAQHVMETVNVSSSELPDFLQSPDVAWALLRSSGQRLLNTRIQSGSYGVDLAGLDKVLGSRGRTQNLLEMCRANPTPNNDDELILTAAEQALRRAERASSNAELPG